MVESQPAKLGRSSLSRRNAPLEDRVDPLWRESEWPVRCTAMSDSPTSPVDTQTSMETNAADIVSVADVTALMRRHRGKFAGLAAAIIIVVSTIGYFATSGEPYYEAEALVIATELEIRIESLPRTAVAIFNGGTVAVRAALLSGTGINPDDLIPAIVEVNPLENTGVIEIDARHPDPELAALYANSAGRALAEEMNLVGPGLGTFSLQIPAPVPEKPVEQSFLPIIAIGFVAAAVLVVGVAALAAMLARETGSASAARPQAPTVPPRPAPRPVVTSERAKPKAASPDSDDHRSKKKQSQPGEDDLTELKVDQIEPFLHHLDRIPRPGPLHPLASSAEQAYALMESISGVGPVFGARLAALGITKVSELAAADPKWVADAVEVRREVVIDWIRQAMGLHSELHEDAGTADDG